MYAASAQKYEFLFDRETEGDRLDQRAVGFQRTKAVRAGRMLYIACFPVWNTRKMSERAKGAPKNAKAIEDVNRRNRKIKFEQLVEANFGQEDFYFTTTYTEAPHGNRKMSEADYEGEPQNEREAQANVRKFVRALRALVKRKGGDAKKLRYVYVTEETWSRHPDPQWVQARYHHHMLIGSAVGTDRDGREVRLTRDEIEDLWQSMPFCGGRTRCDRLQPDRKSGLAGVANYFMKGDAREIGKKEQGKRHRFACSKNLKRPRERTADHKISRRKVQRLAEDVRANAKDILEGMYPGYELAEDAKVKLSNYVEGAYIYAKMVRRDEVEQSGRAAGKRAGGDGERGTAGAVSVGGVQSGEVS